MKLMSYIMQNNSFGEILIYENILKHKIYVLFKKAMDIELLQQALENDANLNIINTNIQEIKQKKNEILQELGLKRDDLKSFHKKLNGYMYVDNLKDLKYGRNIRWINLNKIELIKITNGSILCDIKIHDKGIALVLKGYNHSFITLYLNENIVFQKINDEEKILLKAVDYLNKQG